MANHRTCNHKKGLMDVITSFISNSQAAVLMQPTQSSFHYPAIESQATAMFRMAFGDMGFNSHLTQRLAMRLGVIGTVGIQLVKAITRCAGVAFYRGNIIDQRQQFGNVVLIGGCGVRYDRNAVAIGENMMLGTGFSAVYRARTGFFAPPTARTVALSTAQRPKSIWSAARSLAKRISWIFCQTPASCQSRSRRQQVMPEPQPISCGSISHGIPDMSTNTMPVNVARGGKDLRPGWHFLRGLTGMCGLIISHNSSVISTLAIVIPPCKTTYDQRYAITVPFC